MKTCSKCGVPKDESEFYVGRKTGKLRRECKSCSCKINKERRIEDPQKVRGKERERSRIYRENPLVRAHINAASKERYKNNPEKILRRCRERYKANPEKKLALQRTPEAKTRRRKLRSERQAADPSFRIEHALRGRLRSALKSKGVKKTLKALSLLGCPVVWFEVHLESLFKPGMTLENHGSVWHIDHVKPCAAFDLLDPEQQKACFHWTNLQPLFVKENLSKGAKYCGA